MTLYYYYDHIVVPRLRCIINHMYAKGFNYCHNCYNEMKCYYVFLTTVTYLECSRCYEY